MLVEYANRPLLIWESVMTKSAVPNPMVAPPVTPESDSRTPRLPIGTLSFSTGTVKVCVVWPSAKLSWPLTLR